MKCPVCSGEMKFSFTAKVLRKHLARYEVCDACGFLRAHEPYWLDEAYSSAIAAADTGLVARNYSLAAKLAGALYWVMGERGAGQYLDAAGGYGMLTRLMRDMGFDFYWSDKYCENLLAPRFEYKPELGACRAVTAIEVMEHLTDPAAFIEETLDSAGADALLFTTEPYEGAPPDPGSWWYYTFATGQYIGFFQRRTLEVLGARLGLQLASANGLHVLSKNPVNERVLAMATGRWATRVAPWWIRRHLGSKTVSDHQLMLRGIA
jgi:hypothetical protein